jgi:hypothetical protein
MPHSIDPKNEKLITIAEAAKLPYLKRPNGRPPHVAALYRWINNGLNGVHLDVVRVGSTMMTTEAAVVRFMQRDVRQAHAKRQGASAGVAPVMPRRSARARTMASTSDRRQRAAAILDAAGF